MRRSRANKPPRRREDPSGGGRALSAVHRFATAAYYLNYRVLTVALALADETLAGETGTGAATSTR